MSRRKLIHRLGLSRKTHCLHKMEGSGHYYCSLPIRHPAAHQYVPIDMIEWQDGYLPGGADSTSLQFLKPFEQMPSRRGGTVTQSFPSTSEKERDHASWRQGQIYRQAETQG